MERTARKALDRAGRDLKEEEADDSSYPSFTGIQSFRQTRSRRLLIDTVHRWSQPHGLNLCDQAPNQHRVQRAGLCLL
jgi:hypothetical protein